MKQTQNGHAQRDWRSRLTKDEAAKLALLEWQIEVYDIGRAQLMKLRERIVARASQRAPKLARVA